MNTALIVKTNTFENEKAFINMIRLYNDYYDVSISYTEYAIHKKENRLDKSYVHVNANPYNIVHSPKITGTGEGLFMVFSNTMVCTQDIDDFKTLLAAAEATIEEINKILDQYF